MLKRFFSPPLHDYVAAMEAVDARRIATWLAVVAAFALTWFVYVPIHELLHAFGCIAAGGDVSRLEIGEEYGGALLARVFPFVKSGSSYAGQLTGFDTHGSDVVYLITVLAPYLLTVFAGVPMLERVARAAPRPATHLNGRALLFGAALPIAFAPFISLTGDYYEAGSIVVSRIASLIDPALAPARRRSDDLFKLGGTLLDQHAGALDWAIVIASFVTGLVLAWLTYHCGALVARLGTGSFRRPR